MTQISQIWMKAMLKNINDGKFKSIILDNNTEAKWLIKHLNEIGTPARVTQLGGGTKKITLEKLICQTCGGKGYV